MAEASFGRYVVVGEVGRGAMGIVYRAEDPIIGRMVAIKAINQTVLATVDVAEAEFLERFRREAQVAGGLSHTNIVKVFDLGDDYMVMEFVEGESLADALKRGRIPRARALEILGSIAGALDYAHAQGITHRDVKPSNVMIQTDGTVKVMDFGLARIESSNLTAAGAVLGSASYMAPEIILGRPADARSDIFSFGVLAYEVLTGTRPFPGRTVSVIMMSIVREPPLAATEMALPEEYDHVFSKALAKDPEDRPQTAMGLVDALAAAPAIEQPAPPGSQVGEPGDVSVVMVDADELGPPSNGPEPGLATMLEAEQDEARAQDPTEATLMIVDQEEAQAADQGEATLALSGTPAEAAPGGADATAVAAEPSEAGVDRDGSPMPAGRPPAAWGKPLVLGGGLVAAMLVIGGLAWWAFRGGPSGPVSEPSPATAPATTPATTPETLTAVATATASAAAPAQAPQTAADQPSSRGERTSRREPADSGRTPAAAQRAKVTPPKKIEGRSASLPRDHREDIELPASVLVDFLVTPDGRVEDPRVVESGGEILDALCVEAVSSWRYQPATRKGVAIGMRQKARFTFREN